MQRILCERCRLAFLSVLPIVALFTIITATSHTEENRKTALEHFNAGKALFTAEDYHGAAVEFDASVRLYPTQNGYYNLANCQKALHQYGEALRTIEKMARQFNETMDETIRKKVDALKQTLQSLVGEIIVTVTPEGADVQLNGEDIGVGPFDAPFIVSPGAYTVTASKAGFETVTKSVDILAKEKAHVDISLPELPARLHITATARGATVVINGSSVGVTPLKTPLTLPPDTYLVEVTKPGFEKYRQQVTLGPGANKQVTAELTEIPPAPAPPIPSVADQKSKKQAPIVKRVLYGGLAGTLVLGGGSGIAYAMAAKQAADFEQYDDAYIHKPASRESSDVKRHEAKRKNETYAGIGLGLGIAAGVVGIATGTLWVWQRYSLKHREVAVTVSPGFVTVRF
jgi:tetratricopeptide (TPR) repeat protein